VRGVWYTRTGLLKQKALKGTVISVGKSYRRGPRGQDPTVDLAAEKFSPREARAIGARVTAGANGNK